LFEIGNSLREARLRQRLDFRQVEQATKIRGRYLRALEEEDFEALPAETYVRGFLKTYAEALGLDGQLFVDEYTSRFVPGAERPSALRPRQSRPARRRAERRIETSVLFVALLAIAVMTALVIAAWKFSSGSDTNMPAIRTDTPTTQARDPVTRPKPKIGTQAKVEKANLLLRAARGNCWIEVRLDGAGGKLLYEGTLEKGQSQRFVGKKLWLNAGVPENLAVKLNGDPVTVGGGRPVVVEITATSIAPA
jgi:cytoskeletal protein RodZ